MSKGSRIYTVRIESKLESEMLAEVNRRNLSPMVAEWTVSEWIRKAIQDKLNHSRRSRAKRRKSGPESVADAKLNSIGRWPITRAWYRWRERITLGSERSMELYRRLYTSPGYRREWGLVGSSVLAASEAGSRSEAVCS